LLRFPRVAQQLPRGGLFEGEAAEILHQRIRYQFRGHVYCGEDWTVCYDETQTWPNQGLPRFMVIIPFATTQELMNILKPVKESLICIGYAGLDENITILSQITAEHFCPLGNMQKQLLVF
jgi:hypothetical protein